MTTKDEVKALWKLCFNDSDEFTDLYFNKRYKEEINMAVREGGKIVSALQMIPYPMTFCSGVIPVSYISGACTHPRYREHGVMRRLLKETHRRMYEDGVLLALLIPAEEWLFGYYAKSGYAPGFGYEVRRIGAENLPAPFSSAYRVEVCASPGKEHYRYFDSRLRERKSCILHPEEDFDIIMDDLKLGGGKLLVARAEGGIVGMSFTVEDGGTLYVKELLADNDVVKDALLYEAAQIYKVRAVEYLIPASVNPQYLGMARVIDAEHLLRLFAAEYPQLEMYLRIEGDDVIPENNGYYTVKDGVCLRDRIQGKEYRTHTLASFTRLLLEAEHPYMSLMLN